MFVLGQVNQNEKRSNVHTNPNSSAFSCGHPSFRVVHSRTDLRFQHHPLLRGYISGPKPHSKVLPLLDKYGLLRHIHNRDVHEMDCVGFRQILHQFLDHLRFYNSFRKWYLIILFS